ncbi:Crp/Fnr family transcriptional regulator [Methylopila sp. Yamaguchi]|uniref:Crp/Fnr family transcriptional regulator n=1 Tax=Methylopila sp. Yamaguchi TaxID=1437817 RepID=UPI000CB5B21C|nr:Crp/Fnr family transcriptional regulator [Methylopila sp. Yamaguchi]GBD49609.1 Crp/FNR family transcriptional regulator [Methylopila sp. Yamaguchi]
MSAPSPQRDLRNRPLASLPDADFELLRPRLRLVTMEKGDMLRWQEGPVPSVCFPLSGTISTIVNLSDGRSVEAGMTGFDGMIDLCALGSGVAFGDHIVQGSGEAYMVDASFLFHAAQSRPAILKMIFLAAEASAAYCHQSLACRTFHQLEARFCRWLLMARYHLKSDSLSLTHEFLATMLGAQRSTVTGMAYKLQVDGLISYHRGSIVLADISRLKARSCECYQRVVDRSELAFPSAPSEHTQEPTAP